MSDTMCVAMNPEQTIGTRAFGRLQRFFREASGIALSSQKQALVASRLRKRLVHHRLPDFDAYCDLLLSPEAEEERQHAVDLLTTNETYFFREPLHFELLADWVLPSITRRPLRVWSAACSSGEECYSLAMQLDHVVGREGWDLVGTDLSQRMVQHARRGLYRQARLDAMPRHFLRSYCRRGTGQYEGYLLIERALRERVSYLQHNLFDSRPTLGRFDVVFLRNVLIYFDAAAKREIVLRVIERMPVGGWLFIGRSESLQELDLPLRAEGHSVYRVVSA